jgi:acetylornithine deacetylase/succinyl-diaminopimelate desuccinylase-like protein
MSNVFGLLRGQDSGLPAVMVVAHIDTVFPQDTDLTIRRQGELIYGPGLGDNSIGMAALMAVASMLSLSQPAPKRGIWFVATTREEGLGDLGGMKAAFGTLRDRVGMVINVEGLAFGHVYHAGIAVRRLHVTASAPGGHSWLHFGRPSAAHGIVLLGAEIVSLKPPENPRTTYNIGMLEGGQSINSIATQAGLWLDLRSEQPQALEALEQQVRAKAAMLTGEELQFHLDVVGDRPAGKLEIDHPLVQGALAALELVGVRGSLETGSTDGNVSLAADCPTVTIGITRGGNAHRLDEYIETGPVAAGLKQLITLTLAAANVTDDFIKETRPQ